MTARLSGATTEVDARQFGVKFDGSTDDTAAIQAALDSALVGSQSNPNDRAGRIVRLPVGTGIVQGTLTVPPNVHFAGQGNGGSYLIRQTGGPATPVVRCVNPSTQQTISDMSIISNDTAVDCLHVVGGGASRLNDARQVVRDVVCLGGNRGVVATNSEGQSNELRLSRVACYRQYTHGIHIDTTDAFVESCTAAASGQANASVETTATAYGFWINSNNTRLWGCKAFGQLGSFGGGFWLYSRQQIACSEAQDCRGRGFAMDSSCVVTACMADSCGQEGFYPAGSGNSLNACIAINRGGAYTMPAAVQVDANPTVPNRVQVVAVDCKPLSNGSDPSGSDVRLNGEGGWKSVTYAASYTPDPYTAETHDIGSLTGNITLNAPAAASGGILHKGGVLRFLLRQDGTGGRTVTFNAVYKTQAAIDTTASTVTEIAFRWDGTNWREFSRVKT